MSGFFYTQQVLRDGPISELPEQIDPKIGTITFTRPGNPAETVDQHSPFDILRDMKKVKPGHTVFEYNKRTWRAPSQKACRNNYLYPK